MRVETLRTEHLGRMVIQPHQEMARAEISSPEWLGHMKQSDCFAVLDGDEVLLAGGALPMWENRAQIWSLLSRDAYRHMTGIHRVALRFLSTRLERRLEATCHAGFRPGRHWLQMLGFQYEGTLRGYTPDGFDHDLFARVRP